MDESKITGVFSRGQFERWFRSWRQANLVSASTGESYLLATMVPQLKRKLTRRLSEAEGAVNLMRKTTRQHLSERGVRALRKDEGSWVWMDVDAASKGKGGTSVAPEVEK